MSNFVIIIVMFLSTAGPAAAICILGYGAVKAIARNPSASGKILMVMAAGFIFAEAIAILALLIVYNIFK